MNSDDLYFHYSVLGLSPEASQEEVRSAYRRLAKMYHPDHDRSTDAQVKYAEVRAAYEVLIHEPTLRRRAPRAKREQPPTAPQDSASQNSANAAGEESFKEDSVFSDYFCGSSYKARSKAEEELYFFGWKLNLHKTRTTWQRRPFSLTALPRVILESIDEVIGVEIIFRAFLSSYLHWHMLAKFSAVWASFFIFISLCGSAVFRYYHTRSPLDKGIYFLAAIYYGVGAGAMFTARDVFFGLGMRWLFPIKFVYYALFFYAATMPLWVHPLIWLANGRKRGRVEL
jgi:hypothetical protein